jgi:hypothetical protein
MCIYPCACIACRELPLAKYKYLSYQGVAAIRASNPPDERSVCKVEEGGWGESENQNAVAMPHNVITIHHGDRERRNPRERKREEEMPRLPQRELQQNYPSQPTPHSKQKLAI